MITSGRRFASFAPKGKLYYYPNSSRVADDGSTPGPGPPGPDLQFVAPQLKELIRVSGSKESPVTGVTLRGLELRDTAVTYLEPHGMPSGGDWALQRTAAVFVEGAEGFVLDSCRLVRLDGNAVMLSSYVRDAVITRSEFAWTGATAIAQWGDTEGAGVPESYGMGWDGRAGRQPRNTTVSLNLVRELGIWEKQSAAYFQAKSMLNTLHGNILFNGPRAGVNLNDGFGGGSMLDHNLIFGFCRESGDHGPINAWDRQVYVTEHTDPSPGGAWKLVDEIRANLVIADYDSEEAVDTDDGSAYYDVSHNLFAYGNGGLKSDYGGHDNRHHHNVYAFITHGKCVSITPQAPNHTDGFHDNVCVFQTRPDWTPAYAEYYCNTSSQYTAEVYALPDMHDNRVWQQGANGSVRCLAMAFWDANWTALERWQELGHDIGTVVKNTSDLDTGWLLDYAVGLLA